MELVQIYIRIFSNVTNTTNFLSFFLLLFFNYFPDPEPHSPAGYYDNVQDYLITDTNYYPVNAINRHKIQFSLNQVKDHSMATVEGTCRGDPGAVFLVASTRQFVYGSQGSNLVTKALVLDRLHGFEVGVFSLKI